MPGLSDETRVQELDDDGPADADALAFVDDAHAAFGEQRQNAIAALQDLAFARVSHGESARSVAEIYDVRASTASGAMFFHAKARVREPALEARIGLFGPDGEDAARRSASRARASARGPYNGSSGDCVAACGPSYRSNKIAS